MVILAPQADTRVANVSLPGKLRAELRIRKRILSELMFGEPELWLIPGICDARTGFLDIGANEGVYSWYARRHCAHVYALEPHPELGDRLRTLLGNRGTVLPVAASDHAGSEVLWVPVRDKSDIHTRSSLEAHANPGFTQREVVVSLARVADLGLPPIGVVKIDVEGHEMKAVEGMLPLLAENRPILIIECEERHNAGGVARLMGRLAEVGYDCHYLHRGQLRPGAEFDITRLQRPESAKGVGSRRTPDYVNNFIFVDRADPDRLARVRAALAAWSWPSLI